MQSIKIGRGTDLQVNNFLIKSLLNADGADNADFYFVESKMIANYEKEFYPCKSASSAFKTVLEDSFKI